MRQALIDALRKLDPQHQVRNPVMFVVLTGSLLTTGLFLQALLGQGEAPAGFILAVSLWLWFTVLFANFAEAMAEGRGKAQADALRRARRDVPAKKLASPQYGAAYTSVSATTLRQGDTVLVAAGDFVPSDGEVIEGIASVDESAITGESAPVIREYQTGGRLVAMTGDGTNDAPALAQADVAVAMNTGTQAAKEAGNMVDLDSNPTKLIEVVEIGKQLLITRGALTTFSMANDVAKYFAIIPAAFATTYPALNALNIMRLATPESAILSAVIFNALIIVFLIPLALRGVRYRPGSAAALLCNNLLIYGLGGLIVPFIGIKAIDLFLVLLGLA
jgi:K+-transporting ATPase ATPase B chain